MSGFLYHVSPSHYYGTALGNQALRRNVAKIQVPTNHLCEHS
jgi:hypothetical protein